MKILAPLILLNCTKQLLVYDPYVFRSSSNIFGNLRTSLEIFQNVHVFLGQVLKNFQKVVRDIWKLLAIEPKKNMTGDKCVIIEFVHVRGKQFQAMPTKQDLGAS